MNEDLEALAERLNADTNYRVLRKLQPQLMYATAEASSAVRRALVVDVETTGLARTDVIIEFGVVLFTYDANSGRVLDVLAAEAWLEDPGRPIPAEVVTLTGITDADVAGTRVDEARVRELCSDVHLIIAHNAAFDRPFVDQRFPFLADRHWGCSMNDVPWRQQGVGSFKLDYLLYAHTNTFLGTHHRAVEDCRAALHVLATPFSDGQIPLQLLRTSCRTPRMRVSAVNSPFETKDVLKQRGYTWSGNTGKPPKTWCRELLAQDVEAETRWLREQVYANGATEPLIEKVDLSRRYAG